MAKQVRKYIILVILFLFMVCLHFYHMSQEHFSAQTNALDLSPKGAKKVSIYLLVKSGKIVVVPTPQGSTTDKNVTAKYDGNVCTINVSDPKYTLYDYTISGYNQVTNPKGNPDKCTDIIADKTQGNKAYGWCLGEFSQTGQALLYDSNNNVINRPSSKLAAISRTTATKPTFTLKDIKELTYQSATVHPVGITDTGAASSVANIRIDLSIVVGN